MKSNIRLPSAVCRYRLTMLSAFCCGLGSLLGSLGRSPSNLHTNEYRPLNAEGQAGISGKRGDCDVQSKAFNFGTEDTSASTHMHFNYDFALEFSSYLNYMSSGNKFAVGWNHKGANGFIESDLLRWRAKARENYNCCASQVLAGK